jgi:DNA-binding CsgD family transcriptional regulator
VPIRIDDHRSMLDAGQDTPSAPDPASSLSARETQVLELGALGMTRGEMADHLGVTVSTVKYHLASAYRKLAVTNRSEAVARLLRAGGSLQDNPHQAD